MEKPDLRMFGFILRTCFFVLALRIEFPLNDYSPSSTRYLVRRISFCRSRSISNIYPDLISDIKPKLVQRSKTDVLALRYPSPTSKSNKRFHLSNTLLSRETKYLFGSDLKIYLERESLIEVVVLS